MPLALPETFKKLNERQTRLLIAAAVFLLVFLFCYNIIYKNAVKKAAYYRDRLRETLAQTELRRELLELENAKKAYEELIVQRQDIDAFKNELAKLASSAGAKVLSIGSTQTAGPANYNVFSTALELECSYHRLGKFLAEIESMQPYIGIKNIKLGRFEFSSLAQWEKSTVAEVKPEGETLARVSLLLETYTLRK